MLLIAWLAALPELTMGGKEPRGGLKLPPARTACWRRRAEADRHRPFQGLVYFN